MAVGNIHKFKGHTGSAFHGIFVATRRTETAVTAEWNKFKFATGRAAIHGTAESRVATVDHLVDVFHFGITRMESVFNFFIIVSKNLLQDIHKIIMQENEGKENPKPLKIEG